MDIHGFKKCFEQLSGHEPFNWQTALWRLMVDKPINDWPQTVNIPTGLGKTGIITIWILARAERQEIPRRLVYVVNRRTVVDQTTVEVERLRTRIEELRHEKLTSLAVSTLRGQFADNGEWFNDPSRPAVICGTVDMIGSRLLFSGYRIGFKSRPLHGGFLGQDVLLVHDEAHLEPAFQKLIETIQDEQKHECEQNSDLPWLGLRVMALSATVRGNEKEMEAESHKPFGLTDEEKQPPDDISDSSDDSEKEPPIHKVWRRLKAKKSLRLHAIDDEKKLAEKVAELALTHKDSNAAVLVFVRTIDDVNKVYDKLMDKKTGVGQDHVQQLTGTMRGLERDRMADPRRPDASRVFTRFLKPPRTDAPENERWQVEPMPKTVYLVCTSAGEVGIDISADHMVCDLSTFESMTQRLGRVNRYGEPNEHVARIDVVYPESFGKLDKKTGKLKAGEIDKRRQKTLELLKKLPSRGKDQQSNELYDASPKALGDQRECQDLPCKVEDAFSPLPIILPATDILFDAWAMTSIRQPIPGRPPVEPYLHGIAEWQPPETQVAWRQEIEIITDELHEQYPPADLLDDYPLKPHELLRDRTDRVYAALEALIVEPKGKMKPDERRQKIEHARRNISAHVWLIDKNNAITVTTLGKLMEDDKKRVINRLAHCIVLLPPVVGGLAGGILDGASEQADDVADIAAGPNQRIRVWSDDPEYENKSTDMLRVRSIEIASTEDEDEPIRWEWFESLSMEGRRTVKKPVLLDTHVKDVECHATHIINNLSLPQGIADAIVLAAKLHDHGKRQERFQITLGNRDYPNVLLAKSGRKGARLPEPFRHEFASVLDAQMNEAFDKLSDEMQDLVLHLIAAHHGRARPHFDLEEAFDPERPLSDAEVLSMETPRRFARLQRKYGRWGLAYLESLLRAADWAASANPSAYTDEPEAKP